MDEAVRVVALLRSRALRVATAESCTGGLLGKCLTDVSGSSAVYPGGVISYGCEIKRRVLGVDAALLAREGAVCASVAEQMAAGVRALMQADYALATTGVAGPGSDEWGNPVGLVYLGLATPDGLFSRVLHLSGTRETIRQEAARAAFRWLEAAVSG